MTDTATNTGASGVAGVVAGVGLSVDSSVTVEGAGGPFLVGDITGNGGELLGVVAVADTGDNPDELLDQVLAAGAQELGGNPTTGTPVASGAEVMARFEMPATGVVYTSPDGPTVVYATTTNRRTPSQTLDTPTATPGPPPTASPATPGAGGGVGGLDRLVNVGLEVSVELGRTRVTLADVLAFDVGAMIELDRAVGAPVDIRVNDTLLAHGEVVLVDDEYAVRITAIIDPQQQQP